MSTPLGSLFLILALALIVASAGILAASLRRPTARFSCLGIALCVMPSLICLGLFYSLALHMRQSLGDWPHAIGERGFPPALLFHANMANEYFSALILTTFFAGPFVFIACLLVRPWRRWTLYLCCHVLSLVACIGLMLLAPAPYLNWWWD